MKHFDLYHDCKGVVGLAQATISTDTDTNGASVDKSGYKAVTWFVSGQTITDGAYALKVQDSPDGSAWADASSQDQLGTSISFALTDDDTIKRIGYNGSEKYARLVVTSTATTSGGAFSAIAVKTGPDHSPVADD